LKSVAITHEEQSASKRGFSFILSKHALALALRVGSSGAGRKIAAATMAAFAGDHDGYYCYCC